MRSFTLGSLAIQHHLIDPTGKKKGRQKAPGTNLIATLPVRTLLRDNAYPVGEESQLLLCARTRRRARTEV